METLANILKFLRLLDDDGLLSLSNVAVMVIMVKLCLMPTTSMVDLGALLVALMNYSYKKHVKVKDSSSALTKRMEEIFAKSESALKKLSEDQTVIVDKVAKLGLSIGVKLGKRL